MIRHDPNFFILESTVSEYSVLCFMIFVASGFIKVPISSNDFLPSIFKKLRDSLLLSYSTGICQFVEDVKLSNFLHDFQFDMGLVQPAYQQPVEILWNAKMPIRGFLNVSKTEVLRASPSRKVFCHKRYANGVFLERWINPVVVASVKGRQNSLADGRKHMFKLVDSTHLRACQT